MDGAADREHRLDDATLALTSLGAGATNAAGGFAELHSFNGPGALLHS